MLSEIDSFFSTLSKRGIKNILFSPNFVPFLLDGFSIDQINDFFYYSLLSNFNFIALSGDSMHLCSTREPFCCQTTFSSGRSSFVNYIISHHPFVRSLHPYVSTVCFGNTNAVKPYLNASLHGYGINTPYEYMQKNNFHVLTLNMPIRMTTLIHQAEYIANVPYRYAKSFTHLCSETSDEPILERLFCLNVLVESLRYNANRDYGQNMWHLTGLSEVQSTYNLTDCTFDLLSVNDYIEPTASILASNPSSWLSTLS